MLVKDKIAQELKKENIYMWIPDEMNAACILLHDFDSNPQRFSFLGEYLKSKGIACFAPFLFSDNDKVDLNVISESNYKIQKIIQYLKENYLSVPLFLMGEGYGAVMSLKYSLMKENELDGVVLLSPVLGFSFMNLKRFDLWMDMLLKPECLHEFPIKPSMISKDFLNVEMVETSFSSKCSYTSKFLAEYMSVVKYVSGNQSDIDLPVCMILAKDDLVADNYLSFNLYENISSVDKYINFFSEYHSLSLALNKEDVFYDVFSWIKERTIKNLHQVS